MFSWFSDRVILGACDIAPKINKIDDNDKFSDVWNEFCDKSTQEMETMSKDFEKALETYQNAVRLMGEDPAKMAPDEFFVIWQSFIQKIVATTERIQAELAKAELAAKREAAKAAREAALGAGKPAAAGAAAGGTVTGVRGRGRGRGGG